MQLLEAEVFWQEAGAGLDQDVHGFGLGHRQLYLRPVVSPDHGHLGRPDHRRLRHTG